MLFNLLLTTCYLRTFFNHETQIGNLFVLNDIADICDKVPRILIPKVKA